MIAELVNDETLTYAQIAKQVGTTTFTVGYWANKLGAQRKNCEKECEIAKVSAEVKRFLTENWHWKAPEEQPVLKGKRVRKEEM